MHILFVTITYGLNNETDGVATTVQNLIKHLNKIGVNTSILAYGPKSETYTDPENKLNTIISHRPWLPIKVDPMPYYTDPFFKFSKTFKYMQAQQYDAIVSFTPDFLGKAALTYKETHDTPLFGFFATNLTSQIVTRSKKYFGDHIATKLGKIGDMVCKNFYSKTDAIFAYESNLTFSVVEQTSIPKFYLKAGIDTDTFVPSKNVEKKPTKIPTALFVGRLEAEKNLETLVKVFANIQNCKLKFVGSGSEQAALAKSLPNAVFTGKLTGHKLINEYQSADFFVFPSTNDTLGLVVLEAMACGLPVVAYARGGHTNLIEHGMTGYLAQNIQEFKDFVVELTNNAEQRQRMGLAARKSSQEYSWEMFAKNMMETIADYRVINP